MKSRQNVIILVDYSEVDELRSHIDNRFHYFYKIVNPVNNKYYYGVHSTDNLFDGYCGSGSLLKSVYKKYGKSNCVKYIERFFEDRKSLLVYEKEIVTESMLADPNCYNILVGGGGYELGCRVPTTTGEHVSHEDFEKKQYVHPTKNRVHINNGVKNKLVYPKDLSEFLNNGWVLGETNKSTLGKMLVNFNGEEERFIYETELDGYIKQGWVRGGKSRNLGQKSFARDQIWVYKDGRQIRINPDELDTYETQGWVKGICQSTTVGYVRITDGKNDKNISPNNEDELNYYLSNGWKIGSHSKTTHGKCWVSKDDATILIEPTELDKYISEGWVRGRKNLKKPSKLSP